MLKILLFYCNLENLILDNFEIKNSFYISFKERFINKMAPIKILTNKIKEI